MKKQIATLLLSLASAAALAGPSSTTVTFANGMEGWVGPSGNGGGSWISSTPGRNGAALYSYMFETFDLTYINNSNPAYLGDYGTVRSATFGIDVNIKSIVYDGKEVERNLVLELRDYDNPYNGMPYTAVWYNLGPINKKGNWQRMSVTIPDTKAGALPAGWGGLGSGGPSLPPGRTFADVLASVDEIAFTTFVPDFIYGYTNYDVAIDNVSITTTPR